MSRKRTSVSGDVRKVREFRVELRRFVDENEFQKQGDWFIFPQILELEIDPTISSESNGLLDEEYDSRLPNKLYDVILYSRGRLGKQTTDLKITCEIQIPLSLSFSCSELSHVAKMDLALLKLSDSV